jgi:hypothetical protein
MTPMMITTGNQMSACLDAASARHMEVIREKKGSIGSGEKSGIS